MRSRITELNQVDEITGEVMPPADAATGTTETLAGIVEQHAQHRPDHFEDILLSDERHLEIELIMLTRRAVGSACLVSKARSDLKIAVEPGHHQ